MSNKLNTAAFQTKEETGPKVTKPKVFPPGWGNNGNSGGGHSGHEGKYTKSEKKRVVYGAGQLPEKKSISDLP